MLTSQDYEFDITTIPSDFDVCEIIDKKLLSEKLDAVIDTLLAREARVLHLRFWEELNYTEIAKEFNLCGTYIAQIERNALRKMRHPTRSSQLAIFRETSIEPDIKPENITNVGMVLLKEALGKEEKLKKSRYIKYVSKRQRDKERREELLREEERLLKLRFDGHLPIEIEKRYGMPIRSYYGSCRCTYHSDERYISRLSQIKVRCTICNAEFWIKWRKTKTNTWKYTGYSDGDKQRIYYAVFPYT